MKIKVVSIPVLDQDQALKFYTEKLGFLKKVDVAISQNIRWITVVSKEDASGPEIVLEPSPINFEPAKVYQKALFDAGIPYTQFHSDDVQAEFERLVKLGVEFSKAPTEMGTVKVALFNDTCGNHIQLLQLL